MSTNLIWIDLEMTGLDAEKHVIIEIASIITDEDLNIIAEGPDIFINYPENVLNSMEEWSQIHHKKSGLTDLARASSYDCRSAEKESLRFLSAYCSQEESPLCGNSVWQDRRFLIRYMPDLERFLNYRNIDVSSIKELVNRWYPSFRPYEKEKRHLALMDIKESIMELRYYRKTFFK